jgi:acetyltransferase-like isoleucine patch superfamily enzyme
LWILELYKMKFNNKNIEIGTNVQLGSNVRIGDNTIIYDNVVIGDNTVISNNCVIGEPLNAYYHDVNYENPVLTIGASSLIRSHTIIYAGSSFGSNFQTGHHVTIREKTRAGSHCSFGSYNDIQGSCEIGNYCRFQSFVNIGQLSIIKDFVFIYPYVVLTNDPTPPSENLKGVFIDSYAQIGAGSTILPGAKIGKHALIGAATTLDIDLEDYKFATGSPAKLVGDVRKMPFFTNNQRHYPWPRNFSRGMPWQEGNYEEWLAKQNND